MKLLLQLMGLVVVVLILLSSVLFYLESKDLLQGELGDFTHQMHEIWMLAKETVLSFLQNSGIADDAADFLDQGAEMLRSTESPQPSELPQATQSSDFSATIVITTPAPN